MQVNTKNLNFFVALSSETRLKIIELLSFEDKNIKSIAECLNLSATIIARHISLLENCGIIKSYSTPGIRGIQKMCKLAIEKTELVFSGSPERNNNFIERLSIGVGHYVDYEIEPTCGLASKDCVIGIFDDSRYFSSPDKYKAALLWLQSGWVEYIIPSYLIRNNMKRILLSLEVCSEYPIYKENFKSDIYFNINGENIGKWISPGKPGDKRGLYTPNWWHFGAEYGYLINIEINNNGTFINDEMVSDVNLNHLLSLRKKDMRLKIISPKNTENPGGFTIFGKGFGNHEEAIEFLVEYEQK
ncbi:MAG: ArsR/SmtB family transcription factor [Fusobacteriaceae bacterium]